MRKVAFVAAVCVAVFGAAANAQLNSSVNLLDSPVKSDTPIYDAGEVTICSVTLAGAPALFGTDTVDGSAASKLFVQDELFSPFRVFEVDETCAPLSTYSTAFLSSTMTGIAVDNSSTANYWVVDPVSQTLNQFVRGSGAPSGAAAVALPPSAGLYGSLVVDDNQPGNIACINEIVADLYVCVDVATSLPTCSFINADNAGGGGAFGNGLGDAQDTSICSGGTFVVSSGTISEGQVTRVGQYDCFVTDPACSDQWDVAPISTFVNGIEETEIAGEKSLAVADNVTSTFLILQQPVGISDCQDIDADMDLVYVNGSQGGLDFTVQVATAGTLGTANQRTGAGNGKFVHHMNAGAPSSSTVGGLFDLGDNCFDFLGGTAVVVENNVGKTNLVGASNYFGPAISDPAKAPTFLDSLTQAAIDTGNLSAGSEWTHQSIHLNGAASSSKGGSLSNGIVMQMQ